MRNERGAVGVVVALLMVPLMGFAAIAVDVSALYAARQQLQAGADAGALAVAHDCARGACGIPSSTAQQMATSNLNNGLATATITNGPLTTASGKVTVRNSSVRQHSFAPILGLNESTINVGATAAWGYVSGGTAVLPVTFSYCEFLAQTGGGVPSGITETTMYFTKSSGVVGCTGPSNNAVPGGFGWLDVNSGTCNTTTVLSQVLFSKAGNSVPSSCTTADFVALQGKTVLLPVFDQVTDSGSNAYYRIYGYAAFKITGYSFAGQYSWNPPCGGNDRCIRGYFTQFVGTSDAFDYSPSAPKLGAEIISLTK